MHAVLDGEADSREAALLVRRLASDPAAREEFDALRRLFDGLSIGGLKGRDVVRRVSIILPRLLRQELYQVPRVDAEGFQECIPLEFVIRRGWFERH